MRREEEEGGGRGGGGGQGHRTFVACYPIHPACQQCATFTCEWSQMSSHQPTLTRPRTNPNNKVEAAPCIGCTITIWDPFGISVRRASNAELTDTAVVFVYACVRMRVVTRWRTRREGSWEEAWPTVSKGD